MTLVALGTLASILPFKLSHALLLLNREETKNELNRYCSSLSQMEWPAKTDFAI